MLTNETGLRTTSEHTSGMTRFKNFYIPSKYNLFMSQKRLVPLLLILLTMAIFGCTQQVPEQSQQAQQPQPLEQPQENNHRQLRGKNVRIKSVMTLRKLIPMLVRQIVTVWKAKQHRRQNNLLNHRLRQKEPLP